MASNWQVQQAARVVRDGGVIAYPTEAVWGLGCDPWNEAAVDRLLALKERPVHKGLILVDVYKRQALIRNGFRTKASDQGQWV